MRFAQLMIILCLISFSGNIAAETYDQPPFWTGERVTAERKLFQGRYQATMDSGTKVENSISKEMRPCDKELWNNIGVMFANYNIFQHRLGQLLADDPIWEREKQYLDTLLIAMTVKVDHVKAILKEYTDRSDLLGVINLCGDNDESMVVERPKAELEHPIETFLKPNNQELVPPKVPLRAIER
ncbi:hypothetical protein HN958_02015 [Candidatus Falkowbacteria bacterium]|jgi:hypothetical protein|nr:hypothetical protein [Candidatus Falkowbacteria bacterium]MBT7007260.1 hypothetical protein [Candidatus Falkowbacteria bacterium]